MSQEAAKESGNKDMDDVFFYFENENYIPTLLSNLLSNYRISQAFDSHKAYLNIPLTEFEASAIMPYVVFVNRMTADPEVLIWFIENEDNVVEELTKNLITEVMDKIKTLKEVFCYYISSNTWQVAKETPLSDEFDTYSDVLEVSFEELIMDDLEFEELVFDPED